MIKIQNSKPFNLEDRTFQFAQRIIKYIKSLSKLLTNLEISKQLFRSASSVGANYIEANESLSKKDFIMRIKICRKEAKETRYRLRLLNDFREENVNLIKEITELMKIFGAILEKTK